MYKDAALQKVNSKVRRSYLKAYNLMFFQILSRICISSGWGFLGSAVPREGGHSCWLVRTTLGQADQGTGAEGAARKPSTR